MLASDQRYGHKYTQAELRRMYNALLRGRPAYFGALPAPAGAQLPDYTGVLDPGAQAGAQGYVCCWPVAGLLAHVEKGITGVNL